MKFFGCEKNVGESLEYLMGQWSSERSNDHHDRLNVPVVLRPLLLLVPDTYACDAVEASQSIYISIPSRINAIGGFLIWRRRHHRL
jgi:hypothetical protein